MTGWPRPLTGVPVKRCSPRLPLACFVTLSGFHLDKLTLVVTSCVSPPEWPEVLYHLVGCLNHSRLSELLAGTVGPAWYGRKALCSTKASYMSSLLRGRELPHCLTLKRPACRVTAAPLCVKKNIYSCLGPQKCLSPGLSKTEWPFMGEWGALMMVTLRCQNISNAAFPAWPSEWSHCLVT